MLKLSKPYFLSLTLLIIVGFSFGQTEEGSGISTSFVQEVELEIQLDSAERVFESATYPVPRKVEVEKQTYQAQDYQLKLAPINQKIKVFTVKSEDLPLLDKHYVRAGFGNYFTPYIDLFTGSGRNKEYIYSANVKHLSSKNGPVNKKASGNSQNLLDFSGKYNLSDQSSIRGNINYERLGYKYYGYHLVPEDTTVYTLPEDYSTKQALNFFTTNVGYETKLGENFLFDLAGGYAITGDKNNAKERQVSLNTSGKYSLSEESIIKLDIETFFTKRKDSSSISRNYMSFKPMYFYKKGNLNVNAGAKVVYDNDTISDRSNVHVYPQLHAEFKVVDQLSAYGGFTGDMIRNTYRSMVQQNRYLGSDFVILNTNKAIEFYGGIKGSLNDKLSYDVRLAYQNYKYFNFYINAPLAPMEFVTAYDEDNTTVMNFKSELKYSKPEAFNLALSIDLNSYNLSNFDYAYHRPVMQSKVAGEYKITKNFNVKTDIFYISGLKSLDVLTGESVKLDPIIDLNLGAEYCFNKKLSAFIELNNLLSKKYQYYQYYPVRGLNLMLGATYSF